MAANQLKQQLINLGMDINKQIDVIVEEARSRNVQPHLLRLPDGSWVLPPLLLAKAQVLNGLASLENRR
jgi:hypothetical protein